MKLSRNVMAFAASNMPLFSAFDDMWKHYQYKNGNKKQYEYDTSKTLEEKEIALNSALIDYIIKRSGINYANKDNIVEWFYHPAVIHEAFAVVGAMVDMVLPDSIMDSIGLFTSVHQGGFGDSFNFTVKPRDIFVVSKHGHGQRTTEVHRQYSGNVTIVPEPRELTAAVSLYGVLSGKESLAEFASKIIHSMETAVSLDCYDLFATTMSNLDATATTGLRVSGYSQASLLRLCEQVSAWSMGAKPVVAGTAQALLNVLPDDANYRYFLSDEYVKLGYVPTISGYDLLMIPQVADMSTPFGLRLATDRIWVIAPGSQKIVKLCLEGSTLTHTSQPFDNADLSQTTTFIKMWGTGVATNAIAGCITL